jgi:hypothetical protein
MKVVTTERFVFIDSEQYAVDFAPQAGRESEGPDWGWTSRLEEATLFEAYQTVTKHPPSRFGVFVKVTVTIVLPT